MSYILTERKGPVGIITFNRPEVFNAMNYELLAELEEAVLNMDRDDHVSVMILTGAGKGFMAGADIAYIRDIDVIEAKRWCNNMNRIFNEIDHASKPVIAAVNGAAMGGGCELSLACDIRIASEKAKFALPEVTLGITPGAGGTQRLSRLVGTGLAKELIYTCRQVKAEEAKEIGLANKVVPADDLLKEAKEMMETILTKSPIAIAYCKAAINRGVDTDLRNGLEIEKDCAAIVFGTKDKVEGVNAFLEKRTPAFPNEY